MAPPVVRFEGVSKRYLIKRQAAAQPPDPALVQRDRGAHSDLGPRLWSGIRRVFGRGPAQISEEVWALRDISFEVGRGEVFGIVGANGAGKSTLLKLLSRVTPPTTGWIGMKGRLASLLEVGTGFHPELTGRENVYLNGVILGLSRADIRKRFDRIVAFSGVERYLDTPVKRYSSGMYVRLAFSVAAHLDHELMIVDEVLAVGDASFRERCLSLIETAVRDEGRTVLFVSHDLSQIERLAHRALLLEGGRMKAIGKTHAIVGEYLSGALANVLDSQSPLAVRLETPTGDPLVAVPSGAPCSLVIPLGSVPGHARAELAIDDMHGRRLWTGSTWLAEAELPLRCTFAALPLTAGSYRLRVALEVAGQRIIERPAGDLDVIQSGGGAESSSLATAASGGDGDGPLALAPVWSRG